jgi:hypothetical protein
VKRQWSLVFDLIDGPGEERDMIEKRLDRARVLARVVQRLGAPQQRLARYPNIAPGQEFTGSA